MQRMNSAALLLPNDPDQLKAEVVQLRSVVQEKEQTIAEKRQRIEQLLDYIQLLRKRQFGASADRPNKDQFNLFDEAELEQLLADLDLPTDQDDTESTTQEKTDKERKKPVRRPLPAHFNRVEKIIDLSDEEKAAMGDDWTFIGYDTSEQLAIIPRQHYVIEYKRAKYVPKNDGVADAEQGVRIAPRPDQIIPKSIAHSSVIADVVTRKFVDGLPLYRQETINAREGIDLSRQTMSGWMIQLHERLSPLMAAMKRLLYQGRVIHIDETRLQVLNEPGRENTQLSQMWVYGGGPPDKPVIWYQYADSRSGDVPVEFLYPQEADSLDRAMYLVTDGYDGYNALSKALGILGHAACWAHVRRRFVEATHGRKNTAAAYQMVALIRKLYQVERAARDMTPEERKSIRQVQAEPILEKIKEWLDQKVVQVLPKSPLGEAITYTLGLWPKLTTYLEDGHIEIDNNKAENAIRPFVIGRKAWLFSGSPRGAHASATLYTLVETAKANNLEPWAYLNYLFENLPAAKSEQALLALLPQNLKMEDLKK
ncbi:MAG: IS66 family transposase [Gammaproteobacteria bacterium]|nr:MAG: IS66 family transposase [Gammaproteobacteria bacterium]